MNLAGFCRNCLSKWFREEAQKKGIEISEPDSRKHVYGMPYEEWKTKYQKYYTGGSIVLMFLVLLIMYFVLN